MNHITLEMEDCIKASVSVLRYLAQQKQITTNEAVLILIMAATMVNETNVDLQELVVVMADLVKELNRGEMH